MKRKWTVRTSVELGREAADEARRRGQHVSDLFREGLIRLLAGAWYDERITAQDQRIADLEERVRRLEAGEDPAPAG